MLHFGPTNLKQDYYINNKKLSVFESVSDLGLIVTNSLSLSAHTTNVIEKANYMVYHIMSKFLTIEWYELFMIKSARYFGLSKSAELSTYDCL